MTQILSDNCVSISELKRSPSSVIDNSNGNSVTILSHNKPIAYFVPSKLYKEMLDTIDKYNRVSNNIKISKDLDDLEVEKYLEDWDGCDA